MKRNLALILAGCLAISPLSASVISLQTFAAEQTENADTSETSVFSVYVNDENGCELDEGAEYPLITGETRNLNATIGGNGESSSYFVIWSSEDPDVVSVNSDGALTALSSGAGRIDLDISNGSDRYSFCYTVRVSDPEISEEIEDEIIEEAETEPEASLEEGTEEITSQEAQEPAEEAAAYEEADEEIEEADTVVAETDPEADTVAAEAEPAIEDEAAAAADETTDETEPATEDDTAAIEGEVIEAEIPESDDMMSVNKAPVLATAQSGWVNNGGNWSYINSDGTKATGFLVLDSSTFYLNAQGVMQTGWIKDGSNYMYADTEGRLMKGWHTIDGNIYYFNPKTFARKTGVCRISNKLYVFDANGKQQTGPRWYNSPSGKCYVNGNGTLHTGWLLRDNKWYYFGTNGIMMAGKKLVLGGKIYFLDKNGVMRTGWYGFGPYLYYLSKNGDAVKGWQTINGRKYFFDKNCLAKTGWYKPGNRVYYFAEHGKMQTGIVKVDGYIYYLRSDGIVTTGWKKVDGKWYYLNARSRALTGWLTLGDKKYHLDKNGVMDTGYKTIGGVRYHFGSDGALIPSTNSYSNTEEFIQCIAPLVIKYAPQWNVKVYSPIIAQAILESASGQSSLGKKYNNFFGLKCGTLWTGKSVNLATGEEYTPGTYTTIYANFRVFDSMEEGVKGYFEFLFKDRTRYNNLIGETDPYRYLEKIKEDGYATSSRYVENTYNVIKSYNLTRFDP